MPPPLSAVARVVGLSCAVLLLATAGLDPRLSGQEAPEPPRDDHCACSTGVCPLDPNRRGCSCGCAVAADRQPVQPLARLSSIECRDGMAGPYPCRDIDLLSFVPFAEMGGGQGNDIWGWTDPRTGREYAIVGRSTGTAFVDVTDPRQPVFVGDLPTHTVESIWRGIKVFADHAFVVSEAPDHGMQVFDLRQLARVESPPATFAETSHYGGFGSAHNIALDEDSGVAFAVGTRTCMGGLHIVDVQDPSAPRVAGCYSLDGYTHDAQCVVYRGPDQEHAGRAVCFSANEDTLTIEDVTDAHAVRDLSRTSYDASAYTHQGWLTEDQRFFLVDDEGDERAFGRPTRTFVWDVSDLDAAYIRAVYEAPVAAIDHNLFIRGDLAYEANYRSGLRLLALPDLSAELPREVGFFDIYPADDAPAFNGAWGVYPFFASGTVLVNGIEQGLFVLRPKRGAAGYRRGLSVSLVATGQPATIGRDLPYLMTVRNHGPDRASGVQATLQLPTASASVASSLGSCTGRVVVACDLGDLASGGSAFVRVVLRPADGRELVATAKIVADPIDDDPADNASMVVTRVEPERRELVLRRPIGGELFRLGRPGTVQWTLRGVPGGVRIELSRDNGATWTSLADEAPNIGFFDWTASGPPRTNARIRVTSLADPSLRAVSDGSFAIQ